MFNTQLMSKQNKARSWPDSKALDFTFIVCCKQDQERLSDDGNLSYALGAELDLALIVY